MEVVNWKNNRKFDVTIIGRVTIDLNPTDYYNTLNLNKTFNRYLGGSAANIAVGLARYGKTVNFISRVSKDAFGQFLVDYLKNEKINCEQIQYDPHRRVGLTFTEMISETQSNILMYRDNVADLAIDSTLIDEDTIKNSKVVLISGTSLSAPDSRAACLKVLNLARMHQCLVVFDLDYRPYTWTSPEETSIYYKLVASGADIIIGSEEEFDFLKTTVNDQYEELIDNLLGQQCKIAILKAGKSGSTLFTKNKKIEAGIIPVKLLKGFGGGDAYASAFIANLLEHKPLELALERAVAAASMVVASLSSSDDLPNTNQVDEFIASHEFSKPTNVVRR